jgi:hypothetical protein
MKRLIQLIVFQIIWTTSLSQTLPFVGPEAKRVPQLTNLIVRWEAEGQPWPTKLSVYRVVPTRFSPAVVSNLMMLGSFSETNKREFYASGTNGVIFEKPFSSLRVSFTEGSIEYYGSEPTFTRTQLADVPRTNQLFELTKQFLPRIGIGLEEVAREKQGNYNIRPYNDIGGIYSENGLMLTNITAREVSILRALDGVEFKGDGGYCHIRFGEHGKVIGLQLYWRSVERGKLYASATPKTIAQWIREGRAFQMHMVDGSRGETTIDWSTAKRLSLTAAKANYWGEPFFERGQAGKPVLPSAVYPYAELSGTVESASGNNVHVEIMCPVIDENKPL